MCALFGNIREIDAHAKRMRILPRFSLHFPGLRDGPRGGAKKNRLLDPVNSIVKGAETSRKKTSDQGIAPDLWLGTDSEATLPRLRSHAHAIPIPRCRNGRRWTRAVDNFTLGVTEATKRVGRKSSRAGA